MSIEEWLVVEGHSDERLTEEEWEQILDSVPEDVDEQEKNPIAHCA